ncbi:hypothetical protein AHAS_Ahas10G0016100 [Arachis hypogaea]
MASSWLKFLTAPLQLLIVLLHVAASSSISSRCFTTIYSFGDSIADTGNLYFDINTDHHIPPSQSLNGKIRDWKPMEEGVNFAVGGATALDPSFFVDKGINDIATNYSLGVQLDWFQHLLPSICNSSSGCKEILGKSLFFVGEIGGNDLNHPLFQYTSVDEIMRTYVPNVINEISSTINKLIDVGAQTLLVPGNFPLGCSFFYLNIYHTTDMGEYDHAGCLKWLNKVAKDYNKKLYAELNRLQVLHPHTNIIYADYYHAAYSLYQSPSLFGA